MKLNSLGDTLWTYVYNHSPPSPGGDVVHDITADGLGNIYVVGRICVSTWDDDIVVMKFAAQSMVKEVMYNEPMKRNFGATVFKDGVEFLPQENCGLKVYNVLGRMVVNQVLHQNQKAFIPLQPGVYFMWVEEGKREVIKKVIIL